MPPLVALDATLAGGTHTGDSTYWTGLISGLIEAEDTPEIVLLSDKQAPEGLKFPGSIRWVRLPRRSSRWFSLVSLPLAARRLGAKVFHTQYNLSPLAGKTGVTTIHDVSFFIGPEWFKPKDLFMLKRFVPGSARRAAKVITVSETSKRDIMKHLRVPARKVAVTYNAAPVWFKPAGPEEVSRTLTSLGVSQPYLLAIGARWPRKNLALAIRAADLLPAELPHKLLVVGKEGWGDEGGNDRTVATGYLHNEALPPVYSGADLFLFPSHYEGFGIPLLEAFACGTPVLSSAGGALPEVAGDAAEIIDEMEPRAWADAVVRLLGDSSKLADMRERGLRRAKEFSWLDTARKTIEVYREVAR